MNTIQETFTLPSKGLIYDEKINPTFTIRSMTVADELKRLSPTTTPYLTMCELIEDCLVEPLGIPVADLCLGDYQFMMHKLRIVSFGPEYRMSSVCPYCGTVQESVFNLDDLDVKEYTEEFDDLLTITLPECKKVVKLKFQTPRLLETINSRKTEYMDKREDGLDPTFQYTLESLIDTVDGVKLSPTKLENFVKGLLIKDARKIFQQGEKIEEAIGLDTAIAFNCTNSKCKKTYVSTFREGIEFYNPQIR